MRRLPSAVLAVAATACACAAMDPEPEEYAGLYEAGFEVDSFRPCGMDEAWWVVGGGELRVRYRTTASRDYGTVYAVVRGEVSPHGSYGHLGAYQRELRVTRVVELRPAEPGDCRR